MGSPHSKADPVAFYQDLVPRNYSHKEYIKAFFQRVGFQECRKAFNDSVTAKGIFDSVEATFPRSEIDAVVFLEDLTNEQAKTIFEKFIPEEIRLPEHRG